MTHEKTNETSETREVDAMDDGCAREWWMRHTHARAHATHARTHERTNTMVKISSKTSRAKALGALALVASSASIATAHGATYTTYSAMDAGATNTIVPSVSFGPSTPCVSGTQTLKAGVDSITVSWTGVASGDSVDVKLCYTDIASKPWRKFKDNVKKNKKCKQTAVEKANIAVGETGSSVTIPVELNIAPTTYTIQILSKDSTGGYTSYANDACAFKVESYERLPTNLVGTMSFFIAFSIVVATAGTWYDYKKQSAAAAAWGS